ncbi:hypothetical protein FNH05_34085 [Amycolatopsis rhizosphaerae]|uniref:Uncharacterized protein n=1 Tax=Amycolatopsis rhizosphaerae TaxID=2053003 RepID=A0A558AAB5_9PSEU|nr:hypothetical protein FNH05_34085 [Amycolatopsis rhizosphaerae]
MVDGKPGIVNIGGLQWLDYAQAGPRKAMSLVREQKRQYLTPQGPAWVSYWPLLSGFRRAVSSPEPAAELERVIAGVAGKDDWREAVYRQCVQGFLQLLPRGATGVPAARVTWAESDLRVTLRHLIGLRLRNDEYVVVAPYCKEPPLTQETAEVLLHLMEGLIDSILPGATPVVFDTRHGRRFRLHRRTNRNQLDAYIRGLAAGYLRQWSLAA